MIEFNSGLKNESGTPIMAHIDETIAKVIQTTIKRNFKNWDYKSIGVGYSGTGKSTGTRQFGNYIKYILKKDYNINIDVHVCFTADEFERIATMAPKYSVLILDEGFADLNSNVTRSKDFQKIVNLLQIIRARSFFIYLNLPNFFDLSKSVALFQTNHLFVFETDKNDNRGQIRVFDRPRKQALYLKGKVDLNYYAYRPNFLARFYKDEKAMDNAAYEKKKLEHFTNLNKKLNEPSDKSQRNVVLIKLKTIHGWKVKDLIELFGLKKSQIHQILRNGT